MGQGTVDDVKGRVKEAAGELTENKDMKREGKTDRPQAASRARSGNVKEAAEDAVDKGKDKLYKD